ncbi:MFS transporter [Pseudomonas sp. Irchel s3b6]|uniref:MFS transporter n=1 Tax=Pseudomonas sp. Irchel s3b6 TaxID=2009078 RepID=UPI000BA2F675|nr:MFS transporter [Pseudomonas sp. Irchel s3b6]
MAYRSKITLVYLLGFALDLLNMFASNIALPNIALELHASVTQLAWISNAYMLGLTLIIPLSVWLAARVGERRLILGSLMVFGSASWLAAQAASIEALIGWRLLQGLGGGLLIPVGQALAYRHFPAAERSHLTAMVMLVALLVPALSPAAGGLVVQTLSWRWIYYANLPLALLTLALAIFWLRTDEPLPQRTTLDGLGLVLGAATISLLLVALSLLSESEQRIAGLGVLGLSTVLGWLYVRDGWSKPAPLLDLQLLKGQWLRVAMVVYLFVPGVFIGTSLIAVLYLHDRGFSPAMTGALMLPWAVASGLAITLGKRVFQRLGPKPLLVGGMVLQGLGIALLALIEGPGGVLPILAYALMGLGGSLCSSTAQTLAFLDTRASHMGHASALWNINRQLSFCLGAAFLSSVLSVLGPFSPTAFALCFLLAAALTLLPLPAVLRMDTAALLAHLTPQPAKEKNP